MFNMKIGIITPGGLPVPAVFGGAIETLIENFIKENEKWLNYEIFVFSDYDKKAKDISKKYNKTKFVWFNKGIIDHIINFIFRALKKLKVIKLPFKVFLVNQYIKNKNLEVIIVEGNPVYINHIKSRFNNRCKIIFHIHAVYIECTNGYLTTGLEFSDEVIAVSDYIKSDLLNRFKIDSVKITVVPNCVSETFFERNILEKEKISIKSKLIVNQHEFVIIFAGRLVPDKGLLELIKACKLLPIRINYKLLIIGSFGSGFGKISNQQDDFKNVILHEICGLENKFVLTGYIPNEIFPIYCSIADIAVVPSLCNDAAGLVAIEAMSSSLPVIYSNKGGIREYVSPECGIMVNMDTRDCFEEIAESIVKLHDNFSMRNKMSIASSLQAKYYRPKIYYENMSCRINLRNSL